MPSNWKLDEDFQQLLEKKYNILDIFKSTEFDEDPANKLPEIIKKTKKDIFDPQDRYVIVLFDTCYYEKGINFFLSNLVKMWKHLDIPAYTLILYTNHIGISDEFLSYFEDNHIKDKPTVIETIYNPIVYTEQDTIVSSLDIDEIDYHVLNLSAGAARVHRHILSSFLKKNFNNKVAVSIKGAI